MLIKIDLPITEEKAVKLIYPPLLEFIRDFIGCTRNLVPTKVWLSSESYVVISTLNDSKLGVVNLFNKRSYWIDKGTMFSNKVEGYIIWRRIDTFQQNNIRVEKRVRSFVKENLRVSDLDGFNKRSVLFGMGGEFYLYFLLVHKNYDKFYGFSNNMDIINVATRNLTNYLRPEDFALKLVRYDSDLLLPDVMGSRILHVEYTILINMSTIPINIFKIINAYRFRKVVIITCNQEVFNKRRVLLDKDYRLVSFEHVETETDTVISLYSYCLRF